jgi:hypothetical protein
VKNVKGFVDFTQSVFMSFMSFMVMCFSSMGVDLQRAEWPGPTDRVRILPRKSHEAVKNVKGSTGFTKSVFMTFMSFMVICFS